MFLKTIDLKDDVINVSFCCEWKGVLRNVLFPICTSFLFYFFTEYLISVCIIDLLHFLLPCKKKKKVYLSKGLESCYCHNGDLKQTVYLVILPVLLLALGSVYMYLFKFSLPPKSNHQQSVRLYRYSGPKVHVVDYTVHIL